MPNNLPSVDTAVKVVFCVTSLNRTWQLKLAMPINVLTTWRYRDYVSWVVVDLNPEDDNDIGHFFGEFLRPACLSFQDNNLREHLRLYKSDDPEFTHWHASIAKNTSHVCAAAALVTPTRRAELCHYLLSRLGVLFKT